MMKTRKTLAKRFQLTKQGKLLHRKSGQDHFNSRESSKVTRNKRRDVALAKTHAKNVIRLI